MGQFRRLKIRHVVRLARGRRLAQYGLSGHTRTAAAPLKPALWTERIFDRPDVGVCSRSTVGAGLFPRAVA